MCVLLSEQNLHFANLVADRAYIIEKGHIRYQGTMAELAANAQSRRLPVGLKHEYDEWARRQLRARGRRQAVVR